MENEISPGVKVQVRVRDDAPTKQTPAPQGAAPFRGSGAERRRGLQSGETASMEKTECTTDNSFPHRHSPDHGDPSVSLSLDSSPKRGAKGVDENSPAPQGAAPFRGSGAERRRGLQSGETASMEKTECTTDNSFPHRHSPDYGDPSVSLSLDSSPKRGAKGVDENSPAPQGAAPLRGSPQCAHWGKGSPDSDMEQEGKDSTQQNPPSPSPPLLRAHFARLCAEADALHRADPDFDLDSALRDPAFVRLTAPDVGVPVADAWYALHRREYAETLRRESLEQAAAAVASGSLRPREGGRASGGELLGTDPRHMTAAQRAELRDRIKRGERVYPR